MSINKLFEITSNYLNRQDINLIFELGSRDGMEAISLANYYYNASVVSFECNPMTYPILESNIKNYSRLSSYQYAVSDTNGVIDFYQSVHGNPGSSSIFKKTGEYDYIENLIQHKISVRSTTLSTFLDSYDKKNIDIIWADLQGAELKALGGMGDYIKDVKFIYTEVEYGSIYQNQALYSEIKDFLESKNFIEKHKDVVIENWWGDAIFVNKNLF